MTYDLTAHRESARSWCLTLAATPGWADYAEDKARALVKDDPVLHGDLLRAVEAVNPKPRRTPTRRPNRDSRN